MRWHACARNRKLRKPRPGDDSCPPNHDEHSASGSWLKTRCDSIDSWRMMGSSGVIHSEATIRQLLTRLHPTGVILYEATRQRSDRSKLACVKPNSILPFSLIKKRCPTQSPNRRLPNLQTLLRTMYLCHDYSPDPFLQIQNY